MRRPSGVGEYDRPLRPTRIMSAESLQEVGRENSLRVPAGETEKELTDI